MYSMKPLLRETPQSKLILLLYVHFMHTVYIYFIGYVDIIHLFY